MADEYSTMSSGGAGGATVRASGGDDEHGIGWVIFAGTMLMIVGILNFIYGIAAISNSKFYVRDAQYIVSSLNTWGWIILIIGVLQFFAAVSIWGGTEWGRWVGVLTAGVNAIAQLIFLPAYPFLSLALFAVDILIIYGLLAYAGRKGPAGPAAGY
jgi:hypothetical protein